jgi:hypothetical protein
VAAVVAPSGHGELAGREFGYRDGAHAGPPVDLGVASGQKCHTHTGGDQFEGLVGVGRLGDDAWLAIGRPLVRGDPEVAEAPGGLEAGR